jgi:hypothetical protein
VEAKSFEIALEEGVLVLRVFERSRGIVHFVSVGRVSVNWLLATMEDLLLAEVLKEFLRSSKVGLKAFIAQRCPNKFG